MIFFGFIFFSRSYFRGIDHTPAYLFHDLIFSCTFNSRFSYSFFHPHVYSSINWFSFISVTLILRFLNISEFSITLNGISHIPLNCSLTQDSVIKQQRTTFFTHSPYSCVLLHIPFLPLHHFCPFFLIPLFIPSSLFSPTRGHSPFLFVWNDLLVVLLPDGLWLGFTTVLDVQLEQLALLDHDVLEFLLVLDVWLYCWWGEDAR